MANKTIDKRPTVGIFSFTSCAGCQFEILDLEDDFLDIITKCRILHFPMLKEYNTEGPFDIAFIEGTITRKEDIQKLKDVRSKTCYLVALGTEATFGGVPSIKNFYTEEEIEKPVYKSTKIVGSIRASGIDQYVKVDYYMHGCPINKYEFLSVMKDLLNGKKPQPITYPVCKECREKKNPCLLQKGEPCMGPITHGGCGAPCPTQSVACTGCRGPLEDANVDSIVILFKHIGLTQDDIKRYFIKYAGTSKAFEKITGADKIKPEKGKLCPVKIEKPAKKTPEKAVKKSVKKKVKKTNKKHKKGKKR